LKQALRKIRIVLCHHARTVGFGAFERFFRKIEAGRLHADEVGGIKAGNPGRPLVSGEEEFLRVRKAFQSTVDLRTAGRKDQAQPNPMKKAHAVISSLLRIVSRRRLRNKSGWRRRRRR
jgi:hypothetical protein